MRPLARQLTGRIREWLRVFECQLLTMGVAAMLDGKTELLDCGHPASPHSDFTTGYGVTADGKRHCYSCCAARDVAEMIETGTATLYLVKDKAGQYEITNWPGSLRPHVYHVRRSPYGGGFGSQRTDAWFTGPDGKQWHAVNRGDNQVARCRRLKGS